MTLDVHSCVDGWLQRARVAALALLAVLVCGWAPGVRADALDGQLDVLSAYVVVDNGVYKLMARAAYPLNEDIRAALKDGVALRFDFETVLAKQRRFVPDATVADLVLQRELSWHMVSERYVVRDGERGELGSYGSLDQALQAVGTIDSWPVAVEAQLEPAASYTLKVRASVRRGTLPDALRMLFWWSDSWRRTSSWYTWPLPR
jgi:hypothetical protein